MIDTRRVDIKTNGVVSNAKRVALRDHGGAHNDNVEGATSVLA